MLLGRTRCCWSARGRSEACANITATKRLEGPLRQEANDDLDAAIKTVRDMVSSLRLDVDARRRKVDEILATIRHDITAVETNLEELCTRPTSADVQCRWASVNATSLRRSPRPKSQATQIRQSMP